MRLLSIPYTKKAGSFPHLLARLALGQVASEASKNFGRRTVWGRSGAGAGVVR